MFIGKRELHATMDIFGLLALRSRVIVALFRQVVELLLAHMALTRLSVTAAIVAGESYLGRLVEVYALLLEILLFLSSSSSLLVVALVAN